MKLERVEFCLEWLYLAVETSEEGRETGASPSGFLMNSKGILL